MKRVWLKALSLVGIPLALMLIWQLVFHSGGFWRVLARGVEDKIEQAFSSEEEETTEEVVFDMNNRY